MIANETTEGISCARVFWWPQHRIDVALPHRSITEVELCACWCTSKAHVYNPCMPPDAQSSVDVNFPDRGPEIDFSLLVWVVSLEW